MVQLFTKWITRPLAWASLIVLTLVTYAGTYDAPFVFDDIHAIVENPGVRNWKTLDDAMTAPDQSSFAGRPLVNLSFALQCSDPGKLEPRPLHVVNVILHLVNALLLFELLCLVLKVIHKPQLKIWAWLVTAVWAVHPLNTEAVIYLTQRTELMVSLCMLLTCYASLRYMLAKRWYWLITAVAACGMGMACKENMAAIPLLVLLMDWVLFGKACKTRAWLYAGLGCTWLILLELNIDGPRSGSAGFGVSVSSWHYLLTQSKVIAYYLWQLLTGMDLSIIHTIPILKHVTQTLPQALVPVTMLVLTVYGLIRRHPLALGGAVFFLVLGPSSSFIPIATEVMAERRMYLPGAGVLCVLLLLIGAWLSQNKSRQKTGLVLAGILLCISLCGGISRANDYKEERTLWGGAVAMYPDNPGALNGYGFSFLRQGDHVTAQPYFERAVKALDHFPEAHDNLGVCYMNSGELEKARVQFEKAIAIEPRMAKPHNNLGITFAKLGQINESIGAFNQAIACDPTMAAAHLNMGMLLLKLQQYAPALEHLTIALPLLEPAQQPACMQQMALAELGLNHVSNARSLLERILLVQPDHPQAKALLARIRQVK